MTFSSSSIEEKKRIKWTQNQSSRTLKTDAYVAGNGDFFRLGIPLGSSASSSSKRTFVPVDIPTNGGGNIKSIASGGAHSLVVTSKGEVFATGLNEYGQCGIRIINNADDDKGGENGESSNNNAKTTMNDIVRGWTRVEFRDSTCDGNVNVEIEKAISGPASSHSVCIARGGKRVFAFGKNDRGQLGVGDAFDGKEREEGTLVTFDESKRTGEEREEDVIIVDGATGRESTILISANGDAYYSGKIKTDKDERFSLIATAIEFFLPAKIIVVINNHHRYRDRVTANQFVSENPGFTKHRQLLGHGRLRGVCGCTRENVYDWNDIRESIRTRSSKRRRREYNHQCVRRNRGCFTGKRFVRIQFRRRGREIQRRFVHLGSSIGRSRSGFEIRFKTSIG